MKRAQGSTSITFRFRGCAGEFRLCMLASHTLRRFADNHQTRRAEAICPGRESGATISCSGCGNSRSGRVQIRGNLASRDGSGRGTGIGDELVVTYGRAPTVAATRPPPRSVWPPPWSQSPAWSDQFLRSRWPPPGRSVWPPPTAVTSATPPGSPARYAHALLTRPGSRDRA
jgi:hypothetical protein